MTATVGNAELVKRLDALPRRVGKIGGQSFSYIKLEDAIALAAALESTASPKAIVCDVLTVQHSSGFPDYFTRITCGDRSLTMFMSKIKGRCEYHAAEANWLFNGGDEPDILAFDYTEPEGLPTSPDPALETPDLVHAFLTKLKKGQSDG